MLRSANREYPGFIHGEHQVISSAVVRWDEVLGHGSVSNEVDVMAARGVIPLFISCKVSDIKTARDVLSQNGIETLSADEIDKL